MRRRQFLGALLAAGASRLLPRPTPAHFDVEKTLDKRPNRVAIGVDFGPGPPATVHTVFYRTGGVLCLYPADLRYRAAIDEP